MNVCGVISLGMIIIEISDWNIGCGAFYDIVRRNYLDPTNWRRYLHGKQKTFDLHQDCYWMILE